MEEKNKKPLLDNIESISRIITTIGDIQIVHKVSVYKSIKKDRIYEGQSYLKQASSKVSFAGRMGVPSYYMRETKDYIILTEGLGRYTTHSKQEKLKKGGPRASVVLTYEDLDNIRNLFNNVMKWFTLDEYRNNLFKYDTSGIPYGISNQFEGLSVLTNLSVGNGNFLGIQPSVILDAFSSVGYPGVSLKCSFGKIGECTMSEFMSLRRIVITLIENLYNNTLCLLNHFMMLKQEENQKDYVIY